MLPNPPNETIQNVVVPHLGPILRAERSMPGSTILVEYRRPGVGPDVEKDEDLPPTPPA